MKGSYAAWYLVVAILVLLPAGWRMRTWRTALPPDVEPTMAQAGEKLFLHDWTPNDPLCGGGDGLGPVFNATSCVACHKQGGVGGSGGLQHNVTLFVVRPTQPGQKSREGVIHKQATKYPENLSQVHSGLPSLTQPTLRDLVNLSGHNNRCIPMPTGVHVSQRNTPALFGDKLIDEIPEREIIAVERRQRLRWGLDTADGEQAPVGRALRLADGRIGRFGWKAQTASLADFVQAACANELGLGNPGQAQPRPLSYPDYPTPGLDLTPQQCQQLTAFVASLPRPVERLPQQAASREQASSGKQLFGTIGCAECHTPNLGSVEGLYSDLLLHRMGEDLVGGGSYNEPPLPALDEQLSPGAHPSEWRTPPLWGVADSAPYLHDGRAASLEEAIRLHGGQGARSARRFTQLSMEAQSQLVTFLKTLRAP
jgi:CxxC motif-containing protein (DUF1111 family)